MIPVSQFDALLVGHLIGDFVLQTRWMAAHKASRWLPLVVHAVLYTAVVVGAAEVFGGIHAWAIALIFLTHVALDQRRFVRWWSSHIQGVTAGSADAWVTVMADQAFHVMVLFIVAVWH